MTDPYADLSRLPIEVADAYRAGMMRVKILIVAAAKNYADEWLAFDVYTDIENDLAAREKGSKP